MTAQRQCIFDVLQGDLTHPTAESVYEAARRRLGTISLKTVYQTLHELAAMGEVAEIDLGTGTTRFDPNVESPHHHLVCRRCGVVRDLHADLGPLGPLPASFDGFEVEAVDVVFRGICPTCRSDQGDRREDPVGWPLAGGLGPGRRARP